MSSAVEVPSIHPPKVSGDHRHLSSLAPVTEQRLTQFYGRQRWQSLLRASGWIVAAMVALVLCAVVVDSQVYHPLTRWWLAGILAVSMLLALLVFCVRPLLGKPNWPTIASKMERLCPELRNQLLSAVELATQPLVNDSVSFRHQVQRSAAVAVGPVDVATLLPGRLVRKPVLAGMVAILSLILLCLIPQLKMPQRLMRVLLPWANIGRITFVSIHIESPDVYGDSSRRVFPRGEMAGVVARIDGPKSFGSMAGQVFLEWRLPSESQATSLAMSLVGNPADRGNTADRDNPAEIVDPKSNSGRRFETVLPVEAEALEFRVVAAGAETAWYQLTTIPRPRVDSFEIAITPPEYTQLPMRSFRSESADLIALEGSKVAVSLETTPTASELRGHVNWLSRSLSASQRSREGGDKDMVSNQSLAIDGKQKLFVEFTADGDREFKFDLQHLNSGIKNDFSPTYRVRVTEDLPPQVAWVWPTSSSLLVNHQELLGLKLVARDEFPIDRWIGRYRINSNDWVHVDLTNVASSSPSSVDSQVLPRSSQRSDLQTTEQDWLVDLSKLQVKEGDFVEVQVGAMDRKKQETLSSTLRVMISALNWELAPSPLEQERLRIKQELAQLVEKIKPIEKQIDDIRKSKDLKSSDALQQISELISQLDQQSRTNLLALRKSIEKLLQEPQDRVTQHEMRSVGQWLEKLDHQTLTALEKLQDTTADRQGSPEFADANEDKLRGQLVYPLADTTRQAIAEISQVSESFEAVVDSDSVRRISTQSNRLAEWTKTLYEESKSDKFPAQVMDRRREILVQHVKQLGEALIQTGESSGKHLANLTRSLGTQLEHQINTLERPGVTLKESGAGVQQVLSHLRTQLSNGVQQNANQGRRRATLLAGPSGERLNDSLRSWESGSLQASAQTEKAADRLHDVRALHVAGDTADRQFGADLGNAQRALLQSLKNSASSQDQAKEVRQVADALKKLEAVHALEQANNSLNQLLVQEGQSQHLQQMLIEHPRLWDDYAEQLERTVRLMRESKIPAELVGKTEQLQWDQNAAQAVEKINERMWSNERPVSAKPQLLQLSQKIQELREQMSSIGKTARESLQQRAPTLGELAQNAAQSSAELVDQTQQLSEQLEENKVPDSTARLDSLKKQVEPASKPLQDLEEALIDLAGSKDLLDSQQLQQARKADAALDVVNKAERQLNQSLEAVKPTNSAPDANQQLAKDLEAAAKKQTDVSAAMRNLAEFFDRDSTKDANATADLSSQEASKESVNPSEPQRLEDIAKALNQESTLDASESNPGESNRNEANASESSVYEQAQRLSQIAGLTPEQMLKSLEKQLNNNVEMQAEMSEIASDAAEQALRQLDRSQKRQSGMSTQLEQSDPRTKMQKELMAHDLNSARNEAGNLLQQLLQEATSAAATGQAKDGSNKLQEISQQFNRNLSQVPYVDGHNSIAQLQDASRAIGDALEQVQSEAKKIEESLANAATQAVENQNDQQNNQQLRDAKSRQERIKNSVQKQTEQFKQNLQRVAKSADDQKRQAEQDAKQRREQLSRTEKDLQKQPEQAWLKEAVARQRRELALSETRVQAAKEYQDAIQQRKKSAEEFSEQVKQESGPEINQPNPHVQLAQSLAQQAAKTSQRIASQLEPWEQFKSTPEASEQELNSQSAQESAVQKQVQAASQDLARASRHESRLKHSANSEELKELADSTQNVANQALQQSRDQLSKAHESARSADRPTGQATSGETEASIAAIRNADQEIQKAADEVRELIENQSKQSEASTSSENASSPTSTSSTSTSTSTSTSSSSSSSSASSAPFSPEQMAQMLDELDRQLNDPSSQEDSSQAPSANSNTNSNSSSGRSGTSKLPTTLSQAAQQLAGQLSRQRQSASESSSQSSSQSTNRSTNQSSRQSASSKSNSSSSSSASSSSGANTQPVPSDTVRVLNVPRTNEAWGELRKQEATETTETQRERGSNRYRRAIDAYFKALAESKSVTGEGSKNDARK